ncbi:MAG: magnesium transporter, partial [Deltaproteobacteria bacterium]
MDDDQARVIDAPEDETDDDYALRGSLVDDILEAVEAKDHERLIALMEPLHAADIADVLEQIGHDERVDLVKLYGREFDGDILSEIDE